MTTKNGFVFTEFFKLLQIAGAQHLPIANRPNFMDAVFF